MCRKILCLLLPLLLSACAAQQVPGISAAEALRQSAERMETLQGFQFSISRSGAPAFLDSEGMLSLSKMEGNFVAPDKVQATVRVITPGLVIAIDVISIGATQWQTNPITGQWEQLPPDWGFNPSSLLEAKAGLPAILIADLTDLSLSADAELEEMPGKKLLLISGRLDGKNLYELSNWLIGPDVMQAQIWVDPQTLDLQRALLSEHAGDPQNERTWQIDFWNFNQLIDILPPDMDG